MLDVECWISIGSWRCRCRCRGGETLRASGCMVRFRSWKFVFGYKLLLIVPHPPRDPFYSFPKLTNGNFHFKFLGSFIMCCSSCWLIDNIESFWSNNSRFSCRYPIFRSYVNINAPERAVHKTIKEYSRHFGLIECIRDLFILDMFEWIRQFWLRIFIDNQYCLTHTDKSFWAACKRGQDLAGIPLEHLPHRCCLHKSRNCHQKLQRHHPTSLPVNIQPRSSTLYRYFDHIKSRHQFWSFMIKHAILPTNPSRPWTR